MCVCIYVCVFCRYFLSGAVSGCIAQTVAFPIELIRRRLQVAGFDPNKGTETGQNGGKNNISKPKSKPKPPNFISEFTKIVKTDGALGN